MSSTDSESSDWDLEEYKRYQGSPSPERDSATSVLYRFIQESLMKLDHNQNRVLPPSVTSPVSREERHVFEIALQEYNSPSTYANLPDGLLSVSLSSHQEAALSWMARKEAPNVFCAGGVLAADQGLGKTISMIALILKERVSSKPKSDKNDELFINETSSSTQQFGKREPVAGSLIVCPESVLRQWARELDEKVSEEAKLEVLVYHGGNRTKDPAELARYDVVLTTYAVVAKEVPTIVFDDEDGQTMGDMYGNSEYANKKRKGMSEKETEGNKEIDDSVIDCHGTLAKVNWFRVILDEAQMIKNSRTQMSKSCCILRAKRRWCLTRTPIQNNVDELFSYLRFLKCDPYANYESFCRLIKIPMSRNSTLGYLKLQTVLKAIMLRWTKGLLIHGETVAILLPKTVNLTPVDFSPEERAFYQKLEAESRSQFKTYADAGTVSENYENILLMLLRLRQACDHPLLVNGFSSEFVNRPSSRVAKNLPNYMQVYLLNLLATVHICCLCSDPPEDAVVTLCGHVFCYQCVSEYLTGDGNTCPSPKCKSPIGPEVVLDKATLRNSIANDNAANPTRIDDKSIAFQQDYISSKIKATLEIIRSNCRPKSSNLGGCNGDASSSSGDEGPIKAIVLFQWTRMLDLFEMSLNQYLIEYRRIDVSMSLSSRDLAVKQFNTDPEVYFSGETNRQTTPRPEFESLPTHRCPL